MILPEAVFCVISIPWSLGVLWSAMSEEARLEEARLRAATAGQPAVTSEDGGGTMELEARSPVVPMATKSLSQAQTARLVAPECYRHKLDHMVLTTHCTILWRTSAAEGFWDALCAWTCGVEVVGTAGSNHRDDSQEVGHRASDD